jgi:phosphoenolpyruvate carboxylase
MQVMDVSSTAPAAPLGQTAAPARGSRRSRPAPAPGADAPLIEDIRLLGRILGDVIREQEGAASFDLVERVRQLSVAYGSRARPAPDAISTVC